jgi:hypothetical protein
MRTRLLSALFVFSWSTSAFAATDPCRSKALNAAENAYANNPDRTVVKVLTPGKKYRVTVGIGNAEDGAHDYYVVFPQGCSSTPQVNEVPFVANPLRDGVHQVYGRILSNNNNSLPNSYKIASNALPAKAQTQFKRWGNPASCTAVTAYKVAVSNKPTYTVACAVAHDSIKLSLAIYAADGTSIESASIYGDRSVGQNGVSWQNQTTEKKD